MSARPAAEPDIARVALHGTLDLASGKELWTTLRDPNHRNVRQVAVDLSEVTAADGCAAAILTSYRAELRSHGVDCQLLGAKDQVAEVLRLYEISEKLGPRPRRKAQGQLDQIGNAAIAVALEAQLVIAFFGQMVMGVLNAIRAPRTVNWKELMPTMERAGADAVPIVALINFLVGMVISLQSAAQLHRFGADIYMADLVGISVVREIGPLITAIVVCGRTGAAFAAELGSMQTNEEIDALRTMGFGPMRFLVMPKTIALMFVMPLLTVLADVMGGFGGLTTAVLRLDINPSSYFTETQHAVHLRDFTSGLIKSVAFGLAIALISCQQGLAATGGAEGVGRRTTAAVVTTLFTLILIDALFTVLFEATTQL
ncbi:MAG TPA: MlaE family lipid ABC transporter permease subunit [Polyangiales bacterium]|nr:MlaE family lipid ABC transporter permease subunit [Polyangiales bacterium]